MLPSFSPIGSKPDPVRSRPSAAQAFPRGRIALLGGVMVALVMIGTGCSAPPVAAPGGSQSGNAMSDSAPPTADSPMPAQLGQQLPITALATVKGHEIRLEVAATPQQQALGLMYRDPLPDDQGMLFPLGRPRPVSFWMKNVPVPLDMVFIASGTIQAIEAHVPPCAADPCPTYGPGSQPIDHVIELRAGRAAELGLAVGDAVEISTLQP
ncbi:MAG: DUF192 domain-containing protein [Nodosilinea sp.]